MKKSIKKQDKQQFWGERLSEAPEMRNIAYCAGRDVAARPMADQLLIPYDIWQNRAHVTMLAKKKIIPVAAARKILKGLDEFEKRVKAGKLTLDPRKEDVHTNIEHFVRGFAGGDAAGTMHTGRSRNDQVTTVVRMYVRDRLLAFGSAVCELAEAIIVAAAKNVDVPIAGFTHYQPASITTVGHWFTSYAQALIRDCERIVSCYDRINVSPLGAAASFGTSWPIDRALTAKLLGFDAVQSNTLDCVTNRWEMEADAASAVVFAMTHLSIISQDLIILSAPQFAILKIADRYVTGSSIMPQKRNPDFAEVTRAKASVVQNLMASLFGIARGGLSGFNRDTQWTKYLILDLFAEVQDAPAIFEGVFGTLKVDKRRAEQTARENFVNAVDIADALARESGLPFRKTYEIASRAVKLCEHQGEIGVKVVRELASQAGAKKVKLNIGEPDKIVAMKSHNGGPAPTAVLQNLDELERNCRTLRGDFLRRQTALDKAQARVRTSGR